MQIRKGHTSSSSSVSAGIGVLQLQGCHAFVLSLSVIFTPDCKRPITHIDQFHFAHFE
jgi:hypothetical protein